MLNIEEALKELGEKNLDQIQTETAWKWGSRAAASFENCLSATGSKKLACWSIGEEYFHEAMEHAALVVGEDVLSQLKKELLPYQERAAHDMDATFGVTSDAV